MTGTAISLRFEPLSSLAVTEVERPGNAHESEEATASVILRLLLDEAWIPPRSHRWDWELVLHIAKLNNVLLRTAESLSRRGIEPPHSFRTAAETERRRVRAMLELAGRVSAICRAQQIEFVVAKAFAQLPDFGADLDLIVLTDPQRLHGPLVAELNATRRAWRLESWLAGRAVYTGAHWAGPLDVHFGRLGQVGEHVAATRALVARARPVVVDGIEMPVPTAEDRLLLQVMHRLYGRDALRIGDVVLGAGILRTPGLDWSYIISTAKREGILAGLSGYTQFVDRIYRDVTGRRLEGMEGAHGFSQGRLGELQFRTGLYRFPVFRINATLYARAMFHRARAGDWRGALRLGLVPVVAGARLLRRARKHEAPSLGAATTLVTGQVLGSLECVDALILLAQLS